MYRNGIKRVLKFYLSFQFFIQHTLRGNHESQEEQS